MKSRIEETMKRHDKGYNCAQSVACTYCDLAGIDEETMFRLTEGLGAGMGNMEGTCGAVSGACVLAGMKRSSGNLTKPDSKGSTYGLSKEILNEFKSQNGSVICKELKGINTGKALRSCADCIKDAAEITEKVVFDGEFEK
ncbi:MAG: C-GCAxxG-C-C family protein [Clostridia bacterium]|nr:C-GCAxxG-C-C family protein [Clostridia bacterium]MDY5555051.1 C-GCAxxG-C-C family protein [Blautia sp.]